MRKPDAGKIRLAACWRWRAKRREAPLGKGPHERREQCHCPGEHVDIVTLRGKPLDRYRLPAMRFFTRDDAIIGGLDSSKRFFWGIGTLGCLSRFAELRRKSVENRLSTTPMGVATVPRSQRKGVTAIGRATTMIRLKNTAEASFRRLRFRVDSPVQSYAILFPS